MINSLIIGSAKHILEVKDINKLGIASERMCALSRKKLLDQGQLFS
jgi:hypothetical protein